MVAGLVAGSALCARAQDGSVLPLSACRFHPAATGKVAKILDGRNIILDDGRAIRLAGVEVPAVPAMPVAGETGPASAGGARAALEALLVGQTVHLYQAAPATDRYGRLLAHVYLTRDGVQRSAAHEMLSQGFARVTAHVGNPACAAELLSRERVARAAKLGLWADPYYGLVAAESGAELLAGRGRFTVAEGKVVSVRASGGTIYMNFGRRWSQALTVTILKRHERIFTDAGLRPQTLENRRVRVRGWVDERNGPRIEASRPEQIEIAELN
jgi:endonuclease YncB( thermonuclease family)